MNTKQLILNCQRKDPKSCYEEAVNLFSTEISLRDKESIDVQMTLEVIADSLIKDKEFEKTDSIVQILIKKNFRILQAVDFVVLPELIYYHLFHRRMSKAEQYLRILALKAEEDLLLFAHLLDVFDAYGHSEIVSQVATEIITTNSNLDQDDIMLLESYLVAIDSLSENKNLTSIRRSFQSYLSNFGITSLMAESIFDALGDYLDKSLPEEMSNTLLLEENSFRQYITTLLDIEFLDTYEYAASVLWGAVYLYDFLLEKNKISAEEARYNQDIISRSKAYLLINIPWDGYWRLFFTSGWEKAHSVPQNEYEAEKVIFERNLSQKNDDLNDQPIEKVFSDDINDLSYGKYLPEELQNFEQAHKRASRYTAELHKKHLSAGQEKIK